MFLDKWVPIAGFSTVQNSAVQNSTVQNSTEQCSKGRWEPCLS